MAGLILSHQRCGSSALLRFIRDATGTDVAMEPFNRRILGEQFPSWEVASEDALSAHFGTVLRRSAVVKHIYGQQEQPVEQAVFSHPDVGRIVLLWRERVEAAALSSLIAKTTENWNDALGGASRVGYIDPDRVRRRAEEMASKRATAVDLVQATDKPLRMVSYEDLYEAPDDDRQALLRELISYLGLTPDVDFDAAFRRYISRDKKVNTAATYRHIANVDELAAAFPAVVSPE